VITSAKDQCSQSAGSLRVLDRRSKDIVEENQLCPQNLQQLCGTEFWVTNRRDFSVIGLKIKNDFSRKCSKNKTGN